MQRTQIAGHPVVAIAPISDDLLHAKKRVREHLENSFENGIIENHADHYFQNLVITEDYAALALCQLVVECTIENVEIKEHVYNRIFAWSSVVTPLFLGIIAGSAVSGHIDPGAGTFMDAYIFSWLH